MTAAAESLDANMMRRAIALAMKGRGAVEPNPMVGCVIARGDRILGEGFHQKYGQPHAEPNALAACSEDPRGATAYVTLEPCCHANKKTPPCVPALLKAGIARVVVGCEDPNPKVSGRGISQLREAGVQVDVGILEASCKQLIAPFIARTLHHRPYVTLKWAESADGKVAGPGGQRVQISSPGATRMIHQLRARSDAILVGINTVINDDPILTVREGAGGRNPIRYVLDRHLRIPLESRLIQTAREVPLIVGFGIDAPREKFDALASLGVHLFPAPFAGRVLVDLYTRLVTHLIVEPGPTLAASLLREKWIDRVWVIRSPRSINDPTAPSAVSVPFPWTHSTKVEGDTVSEHLNPESDVFFSPDKSADFLQLAEQRASS